MLCVLIHANQLVQGMCAKDNSTSSFLCIWAPGESAAALASRLSTSEDLIQGALKMQHIFFSLFVFFAIATVLFIIAALIFLLKSVRSGSHKQGAAIEGSSNHSSLTFTILWLSATVAFIVAYSTTLTLSALGSSSAFSTQVPRPFLSGNSVEIFQWIILGLSVLFGLGPSWAAQLRGSNSMDVALGGFPPSGGILPPGGMPPPMGMMPPGM